MKALIYFAPPALLAVFAAVGCVTRISVKPAKPGDNTVGIRYSLPATFLVGTPKADGTMSFELQYLPDENATYAVDATSFMTKHKLDVTIANGLLKKVESTQNAADVAKALIDAGGNVQSEVTKDRRKQQKAAADEAAKKAKGAADEITAKIAAAATALETAKAAEIAAEDVLKKAQYALTLANPDNNTKELITVRNAEIDLATAQAKRRTAETALAEARAADAALKGTAVVPPGGNAPANGASNKPKAWGPVVYRVMTGKGKDATPTLVPVQFSVAQKESNQVSFETSKAVKSPPVEPSAPLFTLTSGAVTALPADGGFAVIEIGTTSDINKVRGVTLLDSQNKPVAEGLAPLSALHSRTAVKVFLRPETPVGTYDLEVAADYGDPKKPQTASDKFRIAVRKEATKKK